MSSRLVQTHLGESKSCCQSVQTMPALHVSSLDTITPVSWIVEDFFFFFFFFCCFPCREAGQCFVWGRLCSGGANEPSSHRPSWLSCHVREHLHRTQSSRDVNEFSCTGACTPSGEMNVSVVAMPVGNQGKGISEVMTVFQPSHRRYSGDSWAKTNHDRCQGEASLIKDKDAKTRVYYYKMCQQVFLALMEEHDTADLMKCFNG